LLILKLIVITLNCKYLKLNIHEQTVFNNSIPVNDILITISNKKQNAMKIKKIFKTLNRTKFIIKIN